MHCFKSLLVFQQASNTYLFQYQKRRMEQCIILIFLSSSFSSGEEFKKLTSLSSKFPGIDWYNLELYNQIIVVK